MTLSLEIHGAFPGSAGEAQRDAWRRAKAMYAFTLIPAFGWDSRDGRNIRVTLNIATDLGFRAHALRHAYDRYMAGGISRGQWEEAIKGEIEYVQEFGLALSGGWTYGGKAPREVRNVIPDSGGVYGEFLHSGGSNPRDVGIFSDDPDFFTFDGEGIPALRVIFSEIPPAAVDAACRDMNRDPVTRKACGDFYDLRSWLKQTA